MSTSQIVEVPLCSNDRECLSTFLLSWRDLVSSALWGTGLLGGLILVIALGIWKWLIPIGDPDNYLGWLFLAAIIFAVWVCRSLWLEVYNSLRPSPEGPTPAERDLAGGVAKVLTADVLRVVEIEEYDDEGAGFLLELGDGRVLAVVSQDLYEFTHGTELEEGEEDTRDNFPQTRIEYRYAPHSGRHLGIRGVGEPLKPVGLAKTDKHHFVRTGRKGKRRFIGAEDGTFYEGTLEDVLARLKYTLRPLPTRDAKDD